MQRVEVGIEDIKTSNYDIVESFNLLQKHCMWSW